MTARLIVFQGKGMRYEIDSVCRSQGEFWLPDLSPKLPPPKEAEVVPAQK